MSIYLDYQYINISFVFVPVANTVQFKKVVNKANK